MKNFFKKIKKLLTYAAIIIACGLYIWAIIILLNENNWIGISTITTLLLAIAAFWTIRQNYRFRLEERRSQALSRVRVWAEKSIQLLTVPSPFNEKEAIEVLRKNIQIVRAGSLSALSDAEALGGEVKQKVQKAVHNFNDLTDKAGSADKSIDFESLFKKLLGYFCEVLQSTSKL